MLPAWQDLLQGPNSQILLFPGCVDRFLELVVLSGSFALLPATATLRAPAPWGQWAPLGLLGLKQLSRLIASYSAVVRSVRL